MNSQPSSVSTRSIVARRRRRAGDDDAHAVRARDRRRPTSRRGVEDRGDDRRRAAQERDAVLLDAAQDLGAVDLAQHDVRPPMPVTAYGMPQPLQWNIGSVCRYTSRSLTPVCQPNVVALTQRLRCVSCTPFGRAVVPLV